MKCANTLCTCSPLPGQNYCCDQCQLAHERADRGEEEMHECQCLHADCANIPARIDDVVAPLEAEGMVPA